MDMVPVELLAHLAAATVLGLVANQAAAIVVPAKQIISGFPRWRWVLSCAVQAALLPALVAMMAQEAQAKGLQPEAWAGQSAPELGHWERTYVLALFASQSRDMFDGGVPGRMAKEADFMMRLHHWVVMFACVGAFFAPAGFGLFIAGTFVLELGSMTYNLRTLYPDSAAVVPLYQVCVVVFFLLFFFCFSTVFLLFSTALLLFSVLKMMNLIGLHAREQHRSGVPRILHGDADR